MPTTTANGISIAYEDHGDPAAPPILLVMGLGGQLTLWPIEFVEALVARGYRVLRYDNRDIGLSTKFDAAGMPNIRRMLVRALFGLNVRAPYRLGDMANDGIGLLDALGIERAHIVGASMGGMISQHIAFTHGRRVRSLTSVMSTTGNRWLPRARKEAMAVLLRRPQTDDHETLIAIGKRAARTIGSPGYPPDEARLDARIRSDLARSYYPVGPARQLAAIIADGDRRQRLRTITAPTLVIHGDADPLVPMPGGVDTAKHIRDARLEIIPGMGHDLPLALVDRLADLIADHVGRH
jgi:pimeloyl-ACP methyl ester carboxylesterase